jgi:putative OPT family oligopeptide transporter
MTIATLMGTCLVFIAIGWTGQVYAPMALVVGGMICIAAANAGGTSQDLKSGYIVGATPRNQQIALFIGAIVSSIVIGLTIKFLDKPTADMISKGMAPDAHAIGSIYFPAPQSTLMATLINGILGSKLDWQFIVVGVFLAITMELCGIKSLSFAIGAYLPLSTTLPIFIGSAIRGIVDQQKKKKNIHVSAEEEELGKGNLFATGLVAGGAVAGVVIAVLAGIDATGPLMSKLNLEEGMSSALGQGGYFALAVAFFAFMGYVLYRIARQQQKVEL